MQNNKQKQILSENDNKNGKGKSRSLRDDNKKGQATANATFSCFGAGLRYTATHTHIKEFHLELCLSAYASVDDSGSRVPASIHGQRLRTRSSLQGHAPCGYAFCAHSFHGTRFLATE